MVDAREDEVDVAPMDLLGPDQPLLARPARHAVRDLALRALHAMAQPDVRTPPY